MSSSESETYEYLSSSKDENFGDLVKSLENWYQTTSELFNHHDIIKSLERLVQVKHFQELLETLDSPHRVVKTETGDYHTTLCVWSNPDCKEGPDSCQCYNYIASPETYFLVKKRTLVCLRDGDDIWHDTALCNIVKTIRGEETTEGTNGCPGCVLLKTMCKEPETCCVCLEDMFNPTLRFFHCGHYFHDACLKEWFKNKNNKCPYCDQIVSPENGTVIFE